MRSSQCEFTSTSWPKAFQSQAAVATQDGGAKHATCLLPVGILFYQGRCCASKSQQAADKNRDGQEESTTQRLTANARRRDRCLRSKRSQPSQDLKRCYHIDHDEALKHHGSRFDKKATLAVYPGQLQKKKAQACQRSRTVSEATISREPEHQGTMYRRDFKLVFQSKLLCGHTCIAWLTGLTIKGTKQRSILRAILRVSPVEESPTRMFLATGVTSQTIAMEGRRRKQAAEGAVALAFHWLPLAARAQSEAFRMANARSPKHGEHSCSHRGQEPPIARSDID